MKMIDTRLDEKQFLDRLETLCRKKERFDRGYRDKDLFVVKRNKNKFWLSKHYALLGRTDGYMNDCLYCQYTVNDNGFVSVKYHFGKHRINLIPFLISFIMGIFMWVGLLIDSILYSDPNWNGIFVAALFWTLGLVGLIIKSKKDRYELETHLQKVCHPHRWEQKS